MSGASPSGPSRLGSGLSAFSPVPLRSTSPRGGDSSIEETASRAESVASRVLAASPEPRIGTPAASLHVAGEAGSGSVSPAHSLHLTGSRSPDEETLTVQGGAGSSGSLTIIPNTDMYARMNLLVGAMGGTLASAGKTIRPEEKQMIQSFVIKCAERAGIVGPMCDFSLNFATETLEIDYTDAAGVVVKKKVDLITSLDEKQQGLTDAEKAVRKELNATYNKLRASIKTHFTNVVGIEGIFENRFEKGMRSKIKEVSILSVPFEGVAYTHKDTWYDRFASGRQAAFILSSLGLPVNPASTQALSTQIKEVSDQIATIKKTLEEKLLEKEQERAAIAGNTDDDRRQKAILDSTLEALKVLSEQINLVDAQESSKTALLIALSDVPTEAEPGAVQTERVSDLNKTKLAERLEQAMMSSKVYRFWVGFKEGVLNLGGAREGLPDYQTRAKEFATETAALLFNLDQDEEENTVRERYIEFCRSRGAPVLGTSILDGLFRAMHKTARALTPQSKADELLAPLSLSLSSQAEDVVRGILAEAFRAPSSTPLEVPPITTPLEQPSSRASLRSSTSASSASSTHSPSGGPASPALSPRDMPLRRSTPSAHSPSSGSASPVLSPRDMPLRRSTPSAHSPSSGSASPVLLPGDIPGQNIGPSRSRIQVRQNLPGEEPGAGTGLPLPSPVSSPESTTRRTRLSRISESSESDSDES